MCAYMAAFGVPLLMRVAHMQCGMCTLSNSLWGLQGQRGSLPSASIMLRQPMQRFTQMQASDIDIYRNEIRKTKNEIVSTVRYWPNSDPPICYMECLQLYQGTHCLLPLLEYRFVE